MRWLLAAALLLSSAHIAPAASLIYVPGVPTSIGPGGGTFRSMIGASGGGGGCTQATTYLARTTGGNEGGNAANITTLICGLVTDGVWTNLDAIYVLAQQNQSDAKLNLIGTSYPLTQVGSFGDVSPLTGTIIFTSYVGFSGFNTANSYFDTGFNPATAPSPHFVQNSANIGVWSYASPTDSGIQLGNNSGSAGFSSMLTHFTDGNFYAQINSSGGLAGVASPGTKGLYVGDRSTSTNGAVYWNGVSQANPSNTSAAPFSADFTISMSSVPTSQTLSEAHIGGSLGALNLALYTRLRTYMTAVGVP